MNPQQAKELADNVDSDRDGHITFRDFYNTFKPPTKVNFIGDSETQSDSFMRFFFLDFLSSINHHYNHPHITSFSLPKTTENPGNKLNTSKMKTEPTKQPRGGRASSLALLEKEKKLLCPLFNRCMRR